MTFELLSTSTPVARKKHRCEWCDGLVEIGEKYERWSGLVDGEFATQAMHVDCFKAAEQTLVDYSDEAFYCAETWPHPRGGHCSECQPVEAQRA